jgi:hydrogenase nickel incorporation protein HypA/HybF
VHELSIALSMIDLAADELERQGGGRVVALHLRLGPLSGVIPEALVSAWDLACESSPLAGCRLVIENVPIVIDCPSCRGPRPVRSIQEICCADCGSPSTHVVTGREMDVVALEMIDDQTPNSEPAAT